MRNGILPASHALNCPTLRGDWACVAGFGPWEHFLRKEPTALLRQGSVRVARYQAKRVKFGAKWGSLLGLLLDGQSDGKGCAEKSNSRNRRVQCCGKMIKYPENEGYGQGALQRRGSKSKSKIRDREGPCSRGHLTCPGV